MICEYCEGPHRGEECRDVVTDYTGDMIWVKTLIGRLTYRQTNPVACAEVPVQEHMNLFVCSEYHVLRGLIRPNHACSVCGHWWTYAILKGILVDARSKQKIRRHASSRTLIGQEVRPGGIRVERRKRS